MISFPGCSGRLADILVHPQACNYCRRGKGSSRFESIRVLSFAIDSRGFEQLVVMVSIPILVDDAGKLTRRRFSLGLAELTTCSVSSLSRTFKSSPALDPSQRKRCRVRV